MAKEKETTTIDEELYDGLQQARKKKPRYFALITKGADVVGLIVQKKKINDGQAAKAKAEAKGSGVITGVCHGQGVELTFEVEGTEPSIATKKIKDFIDEETELALKPQWAVVKTLTEVKEEDDTQPGATTAKAPPPTTEPTPTQPVTEPTTPPTGDPLADLKAKLKALTPAVTNAILASPARKKDLLDAVDICKKQIKAEKATEAQVALQDVARLINELMAGGSTSPTSGQPSGTDEAGYAKAKAKFAACRGIWIRVRDKAVSDIHAIRDAMVAEYKDVKELAQNLARGVSELNGAANRFNDDLKLKFDAFIADPPPPPEAREGIKKETLALIETYRSEIESNQLYEALDQKEFAQVLVKAPLLQTLQAMAKDLA